MQEYKIVLLDNDDINRICNLIRNEFDDCNPKVHWMHDFVSKLHRTMSKLDTEAAREMYHDIELEYGRPPQIETK